MVELLQYEAIVLALGALFFGIILLVKGGNWTIDSAVYVATHHGISPMVVGFTIVAFGTSFPELIVSVLANFQDSPGIAIGNVVGSNIANILLVLGMAGAFVSLEVTRTRGLVRDLAVMLVATIAFGFLIYGENGSVGRLPAGLMLGFLVGYVCWQYYEAKKKGKEDVELDAVSYDNNLAAFGFLLLGLLSIAAGAEFLVKGAKISATMIGIPESVIALSLIAFGTSLPELSTSIIASRKGQDDIVIGNIVGSNVFNILMIIGITGLMKPIAAGSYEASLGTFDIWLALLVAVVLTVILLTKGKISRTTGLLFCGAYLAYNVYIFTASV